MLRLRTGYIFYLFFVRLIFSQTTRYETEDKLHQDLLTKYNKNVLPVQQTNGTTPVVVNMIYYFLGMKDFDDKSGHFSICGSFVFNWIDNNLRWNSTEYEGIQMIHMRKNTIWTPTLVIMNPYNEFQEVGQHQSDSLVYVNSNGGISTNNGAVLDATCQADVTYFPFDEQVCQLTMSSWYYTDSELKFDFGGGKVNQRFAVENGLWDITNLRLETLNYSRISLTVNFKRKPLFYVFNIILPIHSICFLNILVFRLPAESGERTGFSATMLLALAVFLTIVSDRLPESSNLSILGIFLMLEFCMSGLILVLVMLGLRCYHKDTKEAVPDVVQRIITCCSKRKNQILEKEKDYAVDWISVSKVFDVVCFWMFISIFVLSSMCFLIIYC